MAKQVYMIRDTNTGKMSVGGAHVIGAGWSDAQGKTWDTMTGVKLHVRRLMKSIACYSKKPENPYAMSEVLEFELTVPPTVKITPLGKLSDQVLAQEMVKRMSRGAPQR